MRRLVKFILKGITKALIVNVRSCLLVLCRLFHVK